MNKIEDRRYYIVERGTNICKETSFRCQHDDARVPAIFDTMCIAQKWIVNNVISHTLPGRPFKESIYEPISIAEYNSKYPHLWYDNGCVLSSTEPRAIYNAILRTKLGEIIELIEADGGD